MPKSERNPKPECRRRTGWANQLPPHQNMTANFRWAADKIRGLDPNSAQYEADKQYDKALDHYEAQEKLLNGNAAEIEPRYKKLRSSLAQKGPRGRFRGATGLMDFNAFPHDALVFL